MKKDDKLGGQGSLANEALEKLRQVESFIDGAACDISARKEYKRKIARINCIIRDLQQRANKGNG